ncbi:MAG TPA: hypothetical protein PKB13_12685 [Clostridia bacterium]|nr:hypothetical protein [Clostridia bacterium]
MRKRHPIPQPTPVDGASRVLLERLKEESYSESAIYVYGLHLYHLQYYMASQGIAEYIPKVGQAFLEDYFSKHQLLKKASKRSITVVVRRLDDVVLCRASAYHAKRVGIRKSIPARFRTTLDGYLRYCEEVGNKQVTLKRKRQYCELFLHYAEGVVNEHLVSWNAKWFSDEAMERTPSVQEERIPGFLR